MELEGIRDAVALPVSRGGRQAIGVLLVLNDHTRQQWLSASKPLSRRGGERFGQRLSRSPFPATGAVSTRSR